MSSSMVASSLAERARDAALQVADALSVGPVDDLPSDLARGKAGLALFLGYAGAVDRARAVVHRRRAEELLEAACADPPAGLSLYHGFTGVAWVSEHLLELWGEADPEGNAEVDEALAEALDATSPWPDGYDLVSGLCGIGVYALERRSQRAGRRCLELIVERLAESSREEEAGFTFLDGERYDLGLAHGVPGVIGFLSACVRAGEGGPRARALLEGTVRWILSRRRGEGFPTSFPGVEEPGRPARASRSAWCYGDPGVAVALGLAARALEREDWRRDAVAIARRAADRPPEQAGVVDGIVCHGAAGLAHIYRRLHALTGEPALEAAAASWLERTLELRGDEPALAGTAGFYRALLEGGRESDRSFLEGAAGIGLVLLGASSEAEVGWERVLLLG